MTDTQHTPGPWVTKGPHIMEAGPSFNWVASVQVSNMPEWEANARLIAAAPELLEALQDLAEEAARSVYPQPDKPDSAWAKLVRARAAIAKATGRAD